MTTTELTGAVAPLPLGWSRLGLLRGRSRRFWLLVAVALAVALGVLLGTPIADGDTFSDLLRTLVHTPALIGRPDWRFLPALLGLAGLHYVLSGFALQAAAGPSGRIPLGERTLVQLVASAANRLTPTGLGGVAVNSRYLSRRGLAVPEALGAMGGLQLFGAVADALAFVLLLVLAAPLGVPGVGGELSAMSERLHRLAVLVTGRPWLSVGLAAMLVAPIASILLGSMRSGRRGRIVDATVRAGRQIAGLLRRPGDLAVLLASSAGTTLVMALALVVSVAAVAGGAAAHDLGGLLAGYMIGAAVGNAVPVPSGIGSTEAAMAGAVVLAHVTPGQAVAAVLLFRLVTFWGPVPLGLLAMRRLRRTGAI